MLFFFIRELETKEMTLGYFYYEKISEKIDKSYLNNLQENQT